jgi:ATP-binding cassette, subfamily C (CFTR/MRP), member 1
VRDSVDQSAHTNCHEGATASLLGQMKNIKMSGLGRNTESTIASLRADEMRAANPFRLLSSTSATIAQLPLLIGPVVGFALFTIIGSKSGESLDAIRMFSSMSLIILLGQPLFWMIESLSDLMAAIGCFNKVQVYLLKPAYNENRQGEGYVSHRDGTRRSGGSENALSGGNEDYNIEMQTFGFRNDQPRGDLSAERGSTNTIDVRNASLAWASSGKIDLKDVTFSVKKGELGVIVGPVGAGKSTLLKGLLGEVPNIQGQVAMLPLRVSWCEQSPWLTVSLPLSLCYSSGLFLQIFTTERHYSKKYHWIFQVRC